MTLDENVRRGYSNTPAQRTDTQITLKKPLKILLDWLGFTVSTELHDLSTILIFFQDMTGIPPNSWQAGRKNYEGYADSLKFENINIYYNGAENQGIHVDITGQGCRFLEIMYQKLGVQNYNWYTFITELSSIDANLTRFDLACDEFNGVIDVREIFSKLLNGEVTSKFKSWEPAGKHDMNGNPNGLTIYLGSEQSRLQLVIYEKNMQLGLSQNWTRIEMRFKRQRAQDFVKLFFTETNKDIGVIFAGILKDYLTFREPNYNDSNKRRWQVSPFWEEFLQDIEPLRLASALPDRSIVKTRSWLDNQVSKSIAKLYYAYNGIHDQWLNEIFEDGRSKLSKEDYNQIEEYRRLYGNDVDENIKKIPSILEEG